MAKAQMTRICDIDEFIKLFFNIDPVLKIKQNTFLIIIFVLRYTLVINGPASCNVNKNRPMTTATGTLWRQHYSFRLPHLKNTNCAKMIIDNVIKEKSP